jgi:general secretion pathway protein L
MSGLGGIRAGYHAWMDAVAGAVVAGAGRLTFPHRVRVVEGEHGALAVHAGKDDRPPLAVLPVETGEIAGPVPEPVARLIRGSRVELRLQPHHFLFRPLELPVRAADFLGGVVRSQIDRLTPWAADDAVFGFGQPTEVGDRIAVTVAATARNQVTPLVHALSTLGAASIGVSVAGPDGAPIALILNETSRSTLQVARVRRVLNAILLVTALTSSLAAAAATVLAIDLAGKQEDLARRITERRVAMRAGTGAGAAPTALARLEQRKHATPSSVVALEILSQILPDHTFVTELRVEGDKLRLSGVTRDAPALIRLMEQSPHFARATFFAPTTRAQSDPGERFHIEAQMQAFWERS